MSTVRRQTRETQVSVAVRPGSGKSHVDTTDSFLDHMLDTLARYGGFDLEVRATGDLTHHLVEDVAITLGTALADATPDECSRYGNSTIPMDDALVEVVLDAGGRSFYEGPLPDSHYDHFMRSLAAEARVTLHVRVMRGTDRHHIVEAAFKALGMAYRQALAPSEAVFSTKGAVELERGED